MSTGETEQALALPPAERGAALLQVREDQWFDPGSIGLYQLSTSRAEFTPSTREVNRRYKAGAAQHLVFSWLAVFLEQAAGDEKLGSHPSD